MTNVRIDLLLNLLMLLAICSTVLSNLCNNIQVERLLINSGNGVSILEQNHTGSLGICIPLLGQFYRLSMVLRRDKIRKRLESDKHVSRSWSIFNLQGYNITFDQSVTAEYPDFILFCDRLGSHRLQPFGAHVPYHTIIFNIIYTK